MIGRPTLGLSLEPRSHLVLPTSSSLRFPGKEVRLCTGRCPIRRSGGGCFSRNSKSGCVSTCLNSTRSTRAASKATALKNSRAAIPGTRRKGRSGTACLSCAQFPSDGCLRVTGAALRRRMYLPARTPGKSRIRTSRAAGTSQPEGLQQKVSRPPRSSVLRNVSSAGNTITTRRAVRALRGAKIHLRRKSRTQARAGPLPAPAMASSTYGSAALAGRRSGPLTSQRAPSRMRTHKKRAGRIGQTRRTARTPGSPTRPRGLLQSRG